MSTMTTDQHPGEGPEPTDNGLYQAIVKRLKPRFPAGSRDLEWDVLPSTVGRLAADLADEREQNALQLAACDCAAIMDTPETHEQNKSVTSDNPSWSPAFVSVMRRTAECIRLRAELAAERKTNEAACRDWAEDHSHLQKLCREAGCPEHQVTGSKHGVPGIRDLADALVAALREDKARIDWLEQRRKVNDFTFHGFRRDDGSWEPGRWMRTSSPHPRLMDSAETTLRSAIDAARKEGGAT